MQMTLLKKESKAKDPLPTPKIPISQQPKPVDRNQKSARNQKLIAKKKRPVWDGSFLKETGCLTVEGKTSKTKRFRTMITIKTMVCQIQNTLPQKMVFCGKD